MSNEAVGIACFGRSRNRRRPSRHSALLKKLSTSSPSRPLATAVVCSARVVADPLVELGVVQSIGAVAHIARARHEPFHAIGETGAEVTRLLNVSEAAAFARSSLPSNGAPRFVITLMTPKNALLP